MKITSIYSCHDKKTSNPRFALFALQSCTVVRPGEVGVKQRMGKLSNEITTQGPALFNPFTSKIIKVKQMI
jgi:regulator of protease activity HflC (stomatin/prohibitin superfamily)